MERAAQSGRLSLFLTFSLGHHVLLLRRDSVITKSSESLF
ncbi:hypothetical protein BH23CHL4_BH23CHL4_23000 [soil metagenome]